MPMKKKSNRTRRALTAAQSPKDLAEAKSDEPKRVEDLRVVDILTMPLYAEYVEKVIERVKQMIRNWKAGKGKLNPRYVNAFMKLYDAGTLKNTGDVIMIYTQILDKNATGYSAIEREVIKGICTDAFNSVMPILIEDEKKRDNGNGDN